MVPSKSVIVHVIWLSKSDRNVPCCRKNALQGWKGPREGRIQGPDAMRSIGRIRRRYTINLDKCQLRKNVRFNEDIGTRNMSFAIELRITSVRMEIIKGRWNFDCSWICLGICLQRRTDNRVNPLKRFTAKNLDADRFVKSLKKTTIKFILPPFFRNPSKANMLLN